jgi:hypothetical protein
MKRNILAVILLIFACFIVYGQNTNPIDLVLLLDTSSGMSSSYENVNNYITGAFLSEFLRIGDTFHLIAFSGTPRLDVVRRVSARGDVETIIGRMLLQYPVERGSNIAAAVSYAEQYITSLPSRPKKIVIVSTGASDTNNIVNSARQRLNSANTTLDFIQVTPGQPLTNLPSSGRSSVPARTTAVTPPAAATVTTPPPASGTTATTPPAAGTTVTITTPPVGPAPTDGVTTTTPPAATGSSGTGTAETPGTSSQTSPESTSNETSSTVQDGRSGTTEVQESTPSESTGTQIREQETPPARTPERLTETSGSSQSSSLPLIIGIIVLLLLVLGLIIFFASRRLGSSPNRVMAEVASGGKEEVAPFVDHSKDLAKYAAGQTKQRTTPYSDRPAKLDNSKPVSINPSSPLLINLFVEDQNTAIGKRNIHSLKSGYSLTVGGGKSDFLIFLVQIPPNIGEVRRDGSQLTFVPRKSKYFPDLGSNELRDCLNKTIRVISDKHYEMRIRFEMYEDPLIALNRMLMSVSVPG